MTLVPSGFFHLRTPLLPTSAFLAVAEGGAPAVRELAARPDVAEALYLASPGLAARWQALVEGPEPPGEHLAPLERAVGAYLVRMATRPTPFGLFAGVATGQIGDHTDLHVPDAADHVRRSRIDTGVLAAVAEAVERDPLGRDALLVRPTTSLYRASGRTRYVEARRDGSGRSHHLVALDEDEALALVLTAANGGGSVAQLAAALTGDDVSFEEASAYVGELITAGVLVSDLQPTITGPDPVTAMVETLHRAPETDKVAARLDHAQAVLDELDGGGVGQPPDLYAAVHAELSELVPGLDPARLVQVDLFKPSGRLTLGAPVVAELTRAVELLARITPSPDDALERFKVDFDRRYGTRRVPLCEALDEESGIGFDKSGHPGAEESPLLQGLDLGSGGETEGSFRRRDRVLLDLLGRALAVGSRHVALDDEDLDRLAEPSPPPLPDALSVMATILGSPAEIAAGRFRVIVHGATGPSGAQLLGRFCAGDAELEAGVRGHLAAEEAHRPDAIFAEVVHLPEGRVGNILRRPVLRTTEIAFMGRSGAPADRQLTVDDLTVGLEGDRIVLRCPRLDDAEVLPRLSNAHNTSWRSVGVYKLLAALQHQGVAGRLAWDWGALAGAPFLPRVTAGPLVLARARWRLAAPELAALATPEGLQAVRGVRALPRIVAVADGDHELPVALDSPASVEIARHALTGRESATLVEVFASPGELGAVGPDGLFCHEIVVPFHRPLDPPAGPMRRVPRPLRSIVARRFPPGSEWLYLKAYCGPAAADAVLTEAIAPAVAEGRRLGAAEGWFFVRYGDPDWHVRVRVVGHPERLRSGVEPLLTAALAPLIEDGRVWRVQLDTYEREVERYGDGGMLLAEEVFEADSDAVLAIVGLLSGDAGADARWRLALAGTDRLLGDLGFSLSERADWARRRREEFAAEFPGASRLPKQLGLCYRAERKDLETLLWGDASEHWLAPGLDAFRARSDRLADVGKRLRLLADTGRLGVPVDSWAASVAHMHANRLLRSAARAQELVIHSLLERLYRGRLARESRCVQAPLNGAGSD